MIPALLHDGRKKLRYAYSFSRKRIVHTNLQLLYDCNFRCTICDFWKDPSRNRSRLSVADVDRIANQLDVIGPQIISIGGGEPLLHPHILDIIHILSKKHFPVMICNGWYVTPKLARDLFRSGIYEVSVSVDYIDPRRHDRQRGKTGAFSRAVEALKILHANRAHPHQRVHMISVLMDDNLEDIEPLLTLCQDIGITYLLTLYSDCRGTKTKKSVGPQVKVSEYILNLKRRYKAFVALRGYLQRFSQATVEGGITPCHAGHNLCNINNQGDLSLCIDRLDTTVGNVLSQDMRMLEQKLLTLYRQNSCNRCWTSCRGSIETLMYGKNRMANLLDYHAMTRTIK